MLRSCALWLGLALVAACSDNVVQGFTVAADAGQDAGFGFGGAGKQDSQGKTDAAVEAGVSGPETTLGTDGSVTGSALSFVLTEGDFGAVCDATCALQMAQNSTRKLGIRYFKNGKPVADAGVEFVLAAPTELGEVLVPLVPTDDAGLAQSEVKSLTTEGTFDVIARVPDDPACNTLAFQLHVKSKAKGPLSVTLHYVGTNNPMDFGELRVRLIKQETPGQPACAALDLGDTLPKANLESPNLKWDKPWGVTYAGFASQLPPDGSPATFTVIGLAYKVGSGALSGKAAAAGCLDTGATVKYDPATKTMVGESVLVDVADIPPRLQGTYDLTSHIDLVSILPDPVENVLKAILDIVSDPIAGILSLSCKLANGKIDSLCGYIFENPKSPNIKQLAQPFGGVIVKFLDAILLSFLPDNVKTGLATGADLSEILTNLEMGGVLELKQEPDGKGFLAKVHTEQRWTSVTYKWSLGQTCNKFDPNCGKKTFNVEAFQGEIVGSFDLWRDAFKSEIKIGKHGLLVKWGALVNYIVQKQLLPALTFDKKNPSAPPIDSYAKLIKSLLAGKACLQKDTCCDEFGAKLEKQQSLLKKDFLSSTCELMVTLGTGYLEQQLIALDNSTGLQLGAEHCAIFENDGDQFIDSIGAKTAPCSWDMTLTIGGKPAPIKSKFFATRQQ